MAMSGNICRCGTYVRIKRAIKRAAVEMSGGEKTPAPDKSLGHVPKTAQLPIVHGRNMKGSR